ANYFDALGVRPLLGRGFRPEEGEGRNAHPVTVISYLTWQDRYKGDPDIIGKTQYLDGVQHTIIGVAPEKFHGTFIGYSFNFWVPTSMQETFDSTGYKLEDPIQRRRKSVAHTGHHNRGRFFRSFNRLCERE